MFGIDLMSGNLAFMAVARKQGIDIVTWIDLKNPTSDPIKTIMAKLVEFHNQIGKVATIPLVISIEPNSHIDNRKLAKLIAESSVPEHANIRVIIDESNQKGTFKMK